MRVDPATPSGEPTGVAREEVLESQQERLGRSARNEARRQQSGDGEGSCDEQGHGSPVARVPVDGDQGGRHDGHAERRADLTRGGQQRAGRALPPGSHRPRVPARVEATWTMPWRLRCSTRRGLLCRLPAGEPELRDDLRRRGEEDPYPRLVGPHVVDAAKETGLRLVHPGLVNPARQGRESTSAPPLSIYRAPVACGKAPVGAQNLRSEPDSRNEEGGIWPSTRW